MDLLETFGDFPPVLYRVSNEYWTRELVEHGRLRLSRVDHFTAIEDAVRVDESEGTAHQLIPGDVHKVSMSPDGVISRVWSEPGFINLQIESSTPTYILCLAYPPDDDISALPWKFGDTAARITDPRRFAQDITNWLTMEGRLHGALVVECRKIRYDKGEHSVDLADRIERASLGFSQKPRKYEAEYEYRFAVLPDLVAAQRNKIGIHHHVDLGRRLPYAEIVRRPVR